MPVAYSAILIGMCIMHTVVGHGFPGLATLSALPTKILLSHCGSPTKLIPVPTLPHPMLPSRLDAHSEPLENLQVTLQQLENTKILAGELSRVIRNSGLFYHDGLEKAFSELSWQITFIRYVIVRFDKELDGIKDRFLFLYGSFRSGHPWKRTEHFYEEMHRLLVNMEYYTNTAEIYLYKTYEITPNLDAIHMNASFEGAGLIVDREDILDDPWKIQMLGSNCEELSYCTAQLGLVQYIHRVVEDTRTQVAAVQSVLKRLGSRMRQRSAKAQELLKAGNDGLAVDKKGEEMLKVMAKRRLVTLAR